MNAVVIELQEVNKDVLIGKRNLNCLSCGKKENSQPVVHGTDGRIYRAGNSLKGNKEMTLDFNSEAGLSTNAGDRSRVASANTVNRALRFASENLFNQTAAGNTTLNQTIHPENTGNIHITAPYGIIQDGRKRNTALGR